MDIFQLQQDAETLAYRILNLKAKAAVVESDDEQRQRGRVALAKVLRPKDRALDVMAMAFPHPQYSLSHCGSKTIAICANSDNISGIGIDLEQAYPSFKSSRNFLSKEEEDNIPLDEAQSAFYLRNLWAIKEAALKADPYNNGKTLKSYTVLEPGAEQGCIFTPELSITYCIAKSQGASLAVAVSTVL